MCSKCSTSIFRRKLCFKHWKLARAERYHCTWKPCLNPIFALTLCRHHYRAANVPCNVDQCKRPSYCKQVCRYHYHKKIIPALKICSQCPQPVYMNEKCFRHFIGRSCLRCSRPTFSKQLCRRHYMRKWRQSRITGSTANTDTKPDTDNTSPDTTNHNPSIHSSG